MRVRVEEAIHQHLGQVGAKQVIRETGAVHLQPGDPAQRGDLGAGHVFHREDARRGVVVDRRRHDDPAEISQVVSKQREVLGLLSVVELAQKAAAELLEHLSELVSTAHGGVLIEKFGDVLQGLELIGDSRSYSRALDLHRDLAPVTKRSPVHLPQRRGRQGRGLELGERLGQANAELRGDEGLDLRKGEWLDPILEPREGLDVFVRQKVGPRREKLAELDEGRPHALEIAGQVGGGLIGSLRHHGIVGEHGIETRGGDHITPPVFHQEEGDVLVPLEVLRLQR